jgi:mono/diheme cytochrome c family protein
MGSLLSVSARHARLVPPCHLVTLSPCHLVIFLLLLAGCDLPGKPSLAERERVAGEVMDFGVLYRQNCAACHGADGKLGPAPSLNDPLFLAIVPDRVLREVVTHGRKETLMPGFGGRHSLANLKPEQTVIQQGTLTAEQADILVRGLRTTWGRPVPNKEKLPSYLAKETGNTDRGKKVFRRACASCHGKDGRGGMNAGAIHNADFLALISAQALRRLVITGRPDLGMPSYDQPTGRPNGFEPLSGQDISDLVALLDSWKQETAGRP